MFMHASERSPNFLDPHIIRTTADEKEAAKCEADCDTNDGVELSLESTVSLKECIRGVHPELCAILLEEWLGTAMRVGGAFTEGVMNGHDANISLFFPGNDLEIGRFGEGCNAFFSLCDYPERGAASIIYRTTYRGEEGILSAYEATLFREESAGELMVSFKKIAPKEVTGTRITIALHRESESYSDLFFTECLADIERLRFFPYGKTVVEYRGDRIELGCCRKDVPEVVVALARRELTIEDQGTGIPLEIFHRFVLTPNQSTKPKGAARARCERELSSGGGEWRLPRAVKKSPRDDNKGSSLLVTVAGIVNLEIKLQKKLSIDGEKELFDIELPLFSGVRQTANRKAIEFGDRRSLESRYLFALIERTVDDIFNSPCKEFLFLLQWLFEGLRCWEKFETLERLDGAFSTHLKNQVKLKLRSAKGVIPVPTERVAMWSALLEGEGLFFMPMDKELVGNDYSCLEELLLKKYGEFEGEDSIRERGVRERLIVGKKALFLPDELFAANESPFFDELKETLLYRESILQKCSREELPRTLCDYVSPLDGIVEPYHDDKLGGDPFLDQFQILGVEIHDSERGEANAPYPHSNFFLRREELAHKTLARSYLEKNSLIYCNKEGFIEEVVTLFKQALAKGFDEVATGRVKKLDDHFFEITKKFRIEHVCFKKSPNRKCYFFDEGIWKELNIELHHEDLMCKKHRDLFASIASSDLSPEEKGEQMYSHYLKITPIGDDVDFVNLLVVNALHMDATKSVSNVKIELRNSCWSSSAEEFGKLMAIIFSLYGNRYDLLEETVYQKNKILLTPLFDERGQPQVDRKLLQSIHSICSSMKPLLSDAQTTDLFRALYTEFLHFSLLERERKRIGEQSYRLLVEIRRARLDAYRERLHPKAIAEMERSLEKKCSIELILLSPQDMIATIPTSHLEALEALKTTPKLCEKLFYFEMEYLPHLYDTKKFWKAIPTDDRIILWVDHKGLDCHSPCLVLPLMLKEKKLFIALLERADTACEFLFALWFFTFSPILESCEEREKLELIDPIFSHIFGKILSLEEIRQALVRRKPFHKLKPPKIFSHLEKFTLALLEKQRRSFATKEPFIPLSLREHFDKAIPFTAGQLVTGMGNHENRMLCSEGSYLQFVRQIALEAQGKIAVGKIEKLVANRTSDCYRAIVKELFQNSQDAIETLIRRRCHRKIAAIDYLVRVEKRHSSSLEGGNNCYYTLLESHDLAGMTKKALFEHFLIPDSTSKKGGEQMGVGGTFGNGAWVYQNAATILVISRDPETGELYALQMTPFRDRSDTTVRYVEISDSESEDFKGFFGTKIALRFPISESYAAACGEALFLKKAILELRFTKQTYSEELLEVSLAIGDTPKEKINRVLDVEISSSFSQEYGDFSLQCYNISEEGEKSSSALFFNRLRVSSLTDFLKNHGFPYPKQMEPLIANNFILSITLTRFPSPLRSDQDRNRLLIDSEARKSLQKALFDALYATLIAKGVKDQRLMAELSPHFVENNSPEQLLLNEALENLEPWNQNFEEVTINDFTLHYRPTGADRSLHKALQTLYFGRMMEPLIELKKELKATISSVAKKYRKGQLTREVSVREIEEAKQYFSEGVDRVVHSTKEAIDELFSPPPFVKEFLHGWLYPKIYCIKERTLSQEMLALALNNREVLSNEELHDWKDKDKTVQSPYENLKTLVSDTKSQLFQVVPILNGMAAVLAGNTPCQYYYADDGRGGYYRRREGTIYLNTHSLKLSSQLELVTALATGDAIHTLAGGKALLSINPRGEGTLVHELQHRSDHLTNPELLEGHQEGPDRFGKIVPFTSRACSWYERRIFSGEIASARQFVAEECRKLGPDFIGHLKEAIYLLEKVEVNEVGSSKAADLFF